MSREVLPRQLSHHFQKSLVLLFELLVLVLDVIQVLEKGTAQSSGVRTGFIRMNIHHVASIPSRTSQVGVWELKRTLLAARFPLLSLQPAGLNSNKSDINSFN